MVASRALPTGDPAYNPGMCPDWESNWQPLGSQASIQSTEAPQSGLTISFKDFYCTGEGMMWVMTAAENGVKYCFCLFVLQMEEVISWLYYFSVDGNICVESKKMIWKKDDKYTSKVYVSL